jgi:hypothetical protein
MTTARSDDDTWDTATSLEATAVMVAVARAAETRRPDPLIRDEYAELLALTPELEPVRKIVASWWAPDSAAYDRKFAAGLQHLVDYQAVRTHFFDEFLATASAAGVRQHVILAGRQHRVRARPAEGVGIQGLKTSSLRRKSIGHPPLGAGRSARRLAEGTA